MEEKSHLAFEPEDEDRFLELPVFTDFLDLSHELTLEVGGEKSTHFLESRWSLLSHRIPAGADRVTFSMNKIFPRSYYPGDHRTLTIRVGIPCLHADPDRHRYIKLVRDNRVLNLQEMREGKSELESTPPDLGIDLTGVCNVKPPCVYCDWDNHKALEGEFTDVPFTRETLEEWGPLFENAQSFINCGIGEPFIMKNLDELLDMFGERDKMLEMATNGQILTDRNIDRLLGRKVWLLISLDAATPETYAKLRNDTLPKILENLRRLIAAKGGRGKFPYVCLVFMPMKVNVHELEDFVKLCADLDVDHLVLRPLNYADNVGLDWERAGHRFVYEDELLPFGELVRVSGRAAELCRQYGVTLSDQLDFGDAGMEEYFPEAYADGRRQVDAAGSEVADDSDEDSEPVAASDVVEVASEEAAPEEAVPVSEAMAVPEPSFEETVVGEEDSLGDPGLPICTEPWKRLYILRRGVLPCCYGQYPLEKMDRWDGVWNSQILQDIRSELAAGRLHSYCLESGACPIVRKRLHGGQIPLPQALRMKFRALAYRVDRLALGVPHKIYWTLRRSVKKLLRT